MKNNKTIKELLEFGIINIDKPSGPTSFNISDFVRKTLGLRKTSHFGTLDPKVTGVLPIALNRACKLTGYFLGEDKEYVGIMRIHEEISLDKIKETIKKKFLGKITQLPPVKSRVKRQEREREVKKFEILEKKGLDVLFKVECEGGTYVRKLIHDLGEELGVGAHMLELRRIRAGIFREETCVNLYDFEKAVEDYKKKRDNLLKEIIIPAEEAIKEIYPVIEIKEDNLEKIFTGKPIHKEDIINAKNSRTNFGATKSQAMPTHRSRGKDFVGKDEIVCVFCEKRFIGMYKIINEGNIFAKPEFVLQDLK